jgi:hypothetical protein
MASGIHLICRIFPSLPLRYFAARSRARRKSCRLRIVNYYTKLGNNLQALRPKRSGPGAKPGHIE